MLLCIGSVLTDCIYAASLTDTISLTEVYFAASQQIRCTSGVRFFVGASDWDFLSDWGKREYILLGNGSDSRTRGNYRKRPAVYSEVHTVEKALLFLVIDKHM